MFEWSLLKDTTARNQKLEPEEILTYGNGNVHDDRVGLLLSALLYKCTSRVEFIHLYMLSPCLRCPHCLQGFTLSFRHIRTYVHIWLDAKSKGVFVGVHACVYSSGRKRAHHWQ